MRPGCEGRVRVARRVGARREEGAETSTVQRLLAGGMLYQLLLAWSTYQGMLLSLHRGFSELMHSLTPPHTRLSD